MIGLTFDRPTHTYTLDGVVVPSVTGILKASGLINFDHIPPHVLGAALDRGTKVHAAIHFANERDLDVDAFYHAFPEYGNYLRAWLSFMEQRQFVPMLNEYRVASRRHQLAGTIDCLGALDGVGALLDFATGNPADVSKDLQTSAYLALAYEWALDDSTLKAFIDAHPVIKRYAVALRRDGTFRIEAYPNPSDFRQFLVLRDAQRIVAARRGELVEVAA